MQASATSSGIFHKKLSVVPSIEFHTDYGETQLISAICENSPEHKRFSF